MDTLNLALIADAGVELASARAALEKVDSTHPLHEPLESAYVALDDVGTAGQPGALATWRPRG